MTVNEVIDVKGKSSHIPDTMKAAYLKQVKEVEVEKIKVPSVSGKEVLVKMMAVGICGSDTHYFNHGSIGKRMVQFPHIQGHECAGEIVAIGEEVTRFNVGDRVAIEPGVPCNTCEWCKLGKYNLCPEVQFLSTPPVKGAFVQYLKHREDFLFQIPDELSYEVATLAEPLSVGIHAFKRGSLEPGQTVFISGMGPVGLMAILAAKSFGAKHIIVSDLEELRLETAKKFGATEIINIIEEELESDLMKSRIV